MIVDYSQSLTDSAQSHMWKTAEGITPSDFSRATHRLRYQAAKLGLEITIRTDRSRRTVSFLTWEEGTCPAHGSDCKNASFFRAQFALRQRR